MIPTHFTENYVDTLIFKLYMARNSVFTGYFFAPENYGTDYAIEHPTEDKFVY